VIDLHAHVLPGFDDGVRSVEEALQLIAAAANEGVTAVAATPHVRADFPTSAERMERGVSILRGELERAGLAVELVTGGEVAIERLWTLDPDEVRRFTYGGAGRWLLLELPDHSWPQLVEQTVSSLARSGIGVLLAHPERNRAVQADPSLLVPLLQTGVAMQITAGSMTGALGAPARESAQRVLELGGRMLLASDAHGALVPGRSTLAAAATALADPALADYLTRQAPASVLAGEEIAPRD
jgi:protein-tyrosine phosphatase